MREQEKPEELASSSQELLQRTVSSLVEKVAILESEIEKLTRQPSILIHELPGGRLPERQTDGAIGFDVYARAILSAHHMDSSLPYLRETIFDFESIPEDHSERNHVEVDEINPDKKQYVLRAGEQVVVGLGFITAMDFPRYFWLTPRSGLSSKHKITLTNTPGTIDPDYRGEAGAVLRNDSKDPWILRQDTRIAQIVFQDAIIPEFIETPREEMPSSMRGEGGFGSTGVYG